MAQQWVDITTIDNVTPFTKVRWRSVMNIADAWFSEAPNLVTDNMNWTVGSTAALGYFGGHRMNRNAYTCSMNCEEYGIDHSTIGYRVCIKDGPRSSYYDDTVVINGETYYEVDFSLWENAAGKSLYMPYAVVPWSPGDIYVLVGAPIISIDKESVSFKSTGGTNTITVTADDNWTATASDSWIGLSSDSGTSGTSTITVSVPDYQMTTKRSGSVVFSCSGESVTLTVKQAAVKTGGFGGIMLGALSASGLYLGDKEVSGLYVGDKIVFPTVSVTTISYKASAQVVPNVAYSDSAWTLTLSSDTYDSATSSGTVTFSGTGLSIPDNAFSGVTSMTEVTLGKGVVSIGQSAFSNTSNLATASLPNTLTAIGQYAFSHSRLSGITIPNSVTTMGNAMFVLCTSLQSVVLPKNLTAIPGSIFWECTGLEVCEIPSGVTTIGSASFDSTNSFTAVTIPAGVTDVAINAFLSSGLEEITFESTTPPTVHNNSFNVDYTAGTIYCPASAVATYTNWLTTTLSGQSISGWTVSANAPSEAAFMFNYNAKQYNSTTRTFPKTDGQLFNEDLVLDMAPTSVGADSVSFVGSRAKMDKTYSGTSANPFNRDSTNKTFTMVYKVGSFTSGSKNLFANRDAYYYNYMVRGSCLHTSNSSFLNMTPNTDPYILLVRVKADGSSERSVLDANGSVLQTVTASSVSWGSATEGVSFFSGQVYGSEYFDGIFYWMYLSNEALSEADVQRVIRFNENL